jgi:hypothetical protein
MASVRVHFSPGFPLEGLCATYKINLNPTTSGPFEQSKIYGSEIDSLGGQ